MLPSLHYVHLTCSLSDHFKSKNLHQLFFFLTLIQTICLYQLGLLPSSPWFFVSPFLYLSDRLIRSRVTYACGTVVPMPALCQSARACLCADVSLVGSPFARGLGGLEAWNSAAAGSGEALRKLQLSLFRIQKKKKSHNEPQNKTKLPKCR